jgi:hypothetical protein
MSFTVRFVTPSQDIASLRPAHPYIAKAAYTRVKNFVATTHRAVLINQLKVFPTTILVPLDRASYVTPIPSIETPETLRGVFQFHAGTPRNLTDTTFYTLCVDKRFFSCIYSVDTDGVASFLSYISPVSFRRPKLSAVVFAPVEAVLPGFDSDSDYESDVESCDSTSSSISESDLSVDRGLKCAQIEYLRTREYDSDANSEYCFSEPAGFDSLFEYTVDDSSCALSCDGRIEAW